MRTLSCILRYAGFVIGSCRTSRIVAPRCTCLLTDISSGVSHFSFMATNDLAGNQANTSPNQAFKGNSREVSTASAGAACGIGGTRSAAGGDESNMPYIVGHDKDNKVFYIQMGSASGVEREEDRAVLEYAWLRPDLVDLCHTEVPVAFRGKGVAKLLAQAALDHFTALEKVKLRLTCTYLIKYVKDNPLPRYTACLES